MAATKKGANDTGSSDDLTPEEEAVQAVEDAAADQGFYGVPVDVTPNEHYTVAGVVAGKPTPETDQEQAAKVGSLKFR